MQLALSKNAASLLIANITHYMCAFRARIEQLPKLTLCSVVKFIGRLILDNAVGIV